MNHNPTADYAAWSNADLVQRVVDLEAQLRSQTVQHTPSLACATKAPHQEPWTKKPRKPHKPFDPSRYTTRLIALKFAYLGGNYNGFEHHANNATPLPTIEEEIWRALKKTKLIFPSRRPGQSEEDVCWDGVEYSKCGRTDRGVSAFGQVIGVRVRSARPKEKVAVAAPFQTNGAGVENGVEVREEEEEVVEKPFDHIRDELPYIQLINRVLPPDVRILAWCPDPPAGFSARFNCKERRYRYFFTNPAYMPLPGCAAVENGKPSDGWLDVEAMKVAATKYEGLHDFRNFCKVDPSKQISNFERRIFHANIHEVRRGETSIDEPLTPKLYYFEVRGSAFLWHQVRHLVAILFLVGQGFEQPSVVTDLLDVERYPGKPVYEMASDIPLVLWECIFPNAEVTDDADHEPSTGSHSGYTDNMRWIYVGDDAGGREQNKRQTTGVEDGKYGRNGIMDELWALWRKRKMDEVLAHSLMEVVSRHDLKLSDCPTIDQSLVEKSARLYDGGPFPRAVGAYIPVARRERMETPDIVNARYAERKGLNGKSSADADADE